MNDRKPNASALLPILVFLVIYLGSGLYFEYIRPEEGRMGFYVISVVVAFGLALIVAFIQNILQKNMALLFFVQNRKKDFKAVFSCP